MHINEFSVINRDRCQSVNGFNHSLDSWSLSDWMTAFCGEVGEAANVIKKLNRFSLPGAKGNQGLPESDLREMLADELADAYCYLDLLIQAAGFTVEQIVLRKFDSVSRRIGYKEVP
jgi:NTP pyrophosphatase (non-canonical NTP hydrolase)